MSLALSDEERGLLADETAPGRAMAMRIVIEAARLVGAPRLTPISGAHADGCLWHGDSGVYFLERLVERGAKVAVPTTCNVGALDLIHPDRVRVSPERRAMAKRLMDAHLRLGCRPSWTCAPYQAGARPGLGEHVAWGESNAVAFVNSVLGARSNRYGDFLDIACAITGRAPYSGLHVRDNRRARLHVDCAGLSERLMAERAFWPVLGAWLGRAAGARVAALTGLPQDVDEDDLKALGAGAAATGAVGLFHIVGVTPEAPDLEATLQGAPAEAHIRLTPEMIAEARDRLSAPGLERVDCVALGSPHYSAEECRRLHALLQGARPRVPIYVCTARHTLAALEPEGLVASLEALGVTFVVDTCVVVTPVFEAADGVMMTDSAKFAHYGKGNTGYESIYGSTAECVASARAGRLMRDPALWG